MSKLLSFFKGIPSHYESAVKRLASKASLANGYTKNTIHYDQIEHGLFVICTTLLNSLLLVTAILILRLHILQMAWLILVYTSLRLVSFGVHFKHVWSCLAVSLTYYLGGYQIALYDIHIGIHIPLLVLAALIYIRYAPSVGAERPLLSSKKRARARLRIFVMLAVYGALSFLLPHPYGGLALVAITCQAINLLPFWSKGGEPL